MSLLHWTPASRQRGLWVFAAAILSCCSLGCGPGDSAAPAPAPASPPAASAISSPAAPEASPQGWLGVLVARQSVSVAPDATGRIETVEVQVGDRVARGDRLASLATEPILQDLAMAEASLRAARAEEARSGVELRNAEARFARRSGLPDTFSQEDLAAARLEQEQATASAEAAAARVAEHIAQVARLQETLEQADVSAPFSGTIAQRFVDPGAMVGPGNPIVRLISSDELILRFAVPPEEASSLSLGDRVTAEASRLRAPVTAIVLRISPEVDIASELIFAEARLEPPLPGKELQAGLDVVVYPASEALPHEASVSGGSSSKIEGTRAGSATRKS